MRFIFWSLVLLALPLFAQQQPFCFSCQFSKRARFEVNKPGLIRLELPPEILSECQPDLGDLRVVNRYGDEIPFVLDPGFSDDKDSRISAVILPAKLEQMEVEGDHSRRFNSPIKETYGLSLPENLPASMVGWRLMLKTPKTGFARRLRVYAGTELDKAFLLGEGSVFRTENPDREKLSLDLFEFQGNELLILIEGEGNEPLNPEFSLQKLQRLPAGRKLELPMKLLTRKELTGQTLLVFEPPRAVAVKRLQFKTSSLAFQRNLQIMSGSRTESDLIFRKPGSVQVEKLSLDLSAPFSFDEPIQVLIENGDSPPLDEVQLASEFNQPGLVLLFPETEGHILFGGGRSSRVAVDLDQWRELKGDKDHFTWWKEAMESWELAKIGESEANPDFDGSPPYAFSMYPGKRVKASQWAMERRFKVGTEEAGLFKLVFMPADLAASRGDLNDLRIVDEENRQWNYVLRGQELVSLSWRLVSSKSEKGETHYEFELPEGKAALRAVLLSLDRPFVHRSATFSWPEETGEVWQERQVELDRKPGQWGDLRFELRTPPISKLRLRIEDGEDEALKLGQLDAEGLMPVALAPLAPGDYRLLLGNSSVKAAEYELEHLAEQLVAMKSRAPSLGSLEHNPNFNRLQAELSSPSIAQILLWCAIGIAVLALGAYSLHLVRLPDSDAP